MKNNLKITSRRSDLDGGWGDSVRSVRKIQSKPKSPPNPEHLPTKKEERENNFVIE